jgi:hypothetical protein
VEADMAPLLAAIAVSQRQPLKAEGVELIVVYSMVATEACTKMHCCFPGIGNR